MSHILAGLSKGVLVFAIKYLNTKQSRLRSRYVLKLSFPKVVIGLFFFFVIGLLKYFPHQHFKCPCVQIFPLLKTALTILLSVWDLSFLTGDQTPPPALEAQSPNRGPSLPFLSK